MIAHTSLSSPTTPNENACLLSHAFLSLGGNSIEASLPIVTITVGKQQCVALLDPAADTVIISKEFLSTIHHDVSPNQAAITMNTTNGSTKNTGLVAKINVSSLDDSFCTEVKALISPSVIIQLKTKLITAKQLRTTWPKISQQAIEDITNLHNGKRHKVDVLLLLLCFGQHMKEMHM